MKEYSYRNEKTRLHCVLAISIGIAVNVLCSYFTNEFGFPLYLDTIGTFFVASLCGGFPGIFTAVFSNLISGLFHNTSIYFGIVNGILAIIAAWFARNKGAKRGRQITLLILISGVVSGVLSTLIQLALLGKPEVPFIADSSRDMASATGVPFFFAFLLINTLFNIADKVIAVFISLVIMLVIPKELHENMWNSGWRQRPLDEDELKQIKRWGDDTKSSMKFRITLVHFAISLLLATIMGFVWMQLFYAKEIEEKKEIASNAAKFAAEIVDPEKVDLYLEEGRDAPGYEETEDLLYKIRDNADGVGYLFLLKAGPEYTTFIFDLDQKEGYEEYVDDNEGYAPGQIIPYEKAIEPYIDDLVEGKEIPPVEVRSWDKWIVSCYYPVYDSRGRCVCYAGADAVIKYIRDYANDFIIRIILIMAAIVLVILAYGLFTTDTFLVYPINSMAQGVENFMKAGNDQKKLDEAVKKLRKYDICTGDEVEKLYTSVCNMAANQAEQLRSLRHMSESTVKMQDGLILTIADLVEKRDSKTGSHIEKTAAYVRIIVEDLTKKGYYAEKISPKFASDVIRSAPLHDVGKINIPDSIINKSGKLSDEEYEIIKTHTTEGKKIMENAISTAQGENYLKEARNMAAYHHERWDGTGYPEGLHGEVIPLSARIMAVADEFDDLTSSRNDRNQYSFDEAVKIIKDGAGTQFDPKCVEAFLDSLPEIKVIYKKYNESR